MPDDGSSDDAERAEEAATDARHAASFADAAREDAVAARDQAVDAQQDAREVRKDVAEVATAVAPDDPLVDTAVRRIEAKASEDKPFGEPGRPISPRSPFRIAFTATLGVALAYLLVQAVISARGVLILLLVAMFLAIGLNPTVERLERRGLRRGWAVALVFVLVLLGFGGFVAAVVPPVVDQGGSFVENLPDHLQDLSSNKRFAEFDERYDLTKRAEDFAENPESFAPRLFGGVLGAGQAVLGAIVSTLTVLILTLYFLSNFTAIKQFAYRLLPRTRRARVGLLTDEILSSVGGYVAGAATIAGIAGFTTFVFLMIVDVPYAVALALVVAITDLIPLIGATIGAVIITTIAFFESVPVGIAALVFYVIYQQVENYVIYPRVMQRSVDVSPAATITAVLIGAGLLGVLGALLAIPIVAAIQLILREVVMPRQDTA